MKEILQIVHGSQKNGPLRDLNLEIYQGEIVVVQGLAGSGIRTLLDFFSGKAELEGGHIFIEEKQVPLRRDHSPAWRRIFVSTEGRNQVNNLSLADNLEILHHPSAYLRLYSAKKACDRAKRYFEQEGLKIDPMSSAAQLSPESQHLLNLMQSRMQHASLTVMDDMRSTCTESGNKELFSRMRRMREEGMSFLILSYHGFWYQTVADRVITLSQGRDIFEQVAGEFDETSLPLFPPVSVSSRIQACGLLVTGQLKENMTDTLGNYRNRNPELWNQELNFSIPSGDSIYDGHTVLIPGQSAELLCKNLSVRDNVIIPLASRSSRVSPGYINPRIAETAYLDCCRMIGLNPGVKVLEDLSWIQRKMLSIDRWRLVRPEAMVLESPYYALDNQEVDQLQQYLIRLSEAGIRLIILSDSVSILSSVCTRIICLEEEKTIKIAT